MKRWIHRAWLLFAYELSWVLFAAGGLLCYLGCASQLATPGGPGRERRVRQMIAWWFRRWTWWLEISGLLAIRWRGGAGLAPGVVYAANHPSLLDATLLLARAPDAICVFKPALQRNLLTGLPARLAGYVPSDAGVDSLRTAAEKIAAGAALIIFPEGTRTRPPQRVGPFKPGFAVIAERARAPLQLVVIRTSAGLMPKGKPWWCPPPVLPAWIEFALDERWEFSPERRSTDLTHAVERRVSEVLSSPA